MVTNQLIPSDVLTLDYLFDTLTETFTSEILSEDFNSFSANLTNVPKLLDSGHESSLPLGDAAPNPVVDTESDLLESLSDIVTDSLWADFDQPILGSLENNINASLGDLYDDPIEYGTPFFDAFYWRQQQSAASCAVVAQICVYQSLTGQYISEYDANNYAQMQGWFDPLTGTPLGYVGHILDALGVPTYEMFNASLGDLQSALSNGDKPIVGLDGQEIWAPVYDWFGNPLEQVEAGHAVWVTGIDYEWNGSIGIIINDSGHPNGMASVVDYYDFMNAWQDYGYFLSVADNPFT